MFQFLSDMYDMNLKVCPLVAFSCMVHNEFPAWQKGKDQSGKQSIP